MLPSQSLRRYARKLRSQRNTVPLTPAERFLPPAAIPLPSLRSTSKRIHPASRFAIVAGPSHSPGSRTFAPPSLRDTATRSAHHHATLHPHTASPHPASAAPSAPLSGADLPHW